MMTAQESKDWYEFGQKVIDLIENETIEKGTNVPLPNWKVSDCLKSLQNRLVRASDEQQPETFRQDELVAIAYLAQLAYTKLKNPSFDRKTAMQHLKAGKAIRPADYTDIIALSYLHGSDLTRYAGVNCGEGKLPIPEQIVAAAEDLGVFFTGMLPSSSNEWVLATQEEIDAVKNWGKSEDMDDSDE
jgi:hypothetical protein